MPSINTPVLDQAYGALGTSVALSVSGVDASTAFSGNTVLTLTSTVNVFIAIDTPALADGTSFMVLANTPTQIVPKATSGNLHAITSGASGTVYITQMVACPISA